MAAPREQLSCVRRPGTRRSRHQAHGGERQHDLVEDVRRRLAEQEGKEDEFEQHYAAVHLQRRAEAAEATSATSGRPAAAPSWRRSARRRIGRNSCRTPATSVWPRFGPSRPRIVTSRRPRGARRVFWRREARGPSRKAGHDAAALCGQDSTAEAQKGELESRVATTPPR